jgi:hypothetical protein
MNKQQLRAGIVTRGKVFKAAGARAESVVAKLGAA